MSKIAPNRVALDLTDEQLAALQLARIEDDIPITTRVRALVVLWMERPDLAADAMRQAKEDVERLREYRCRPSKWRNRYFAAEQREKEAAAELYKTRRLLEIAIAERAQ